MRGLLSHYFMGMINNGLMIGILVFIMLLFRPVLKKLFSPNQRILLWMLLMVGEHGSRGKPALIPISFQDLIISRTSTLGDSTPAFLPSEYDFPGIYNLVLPGDVLVPVPLWDELMIGAVILYFAGLGAVAFWLWRGQRKLVEIGRQGRKLDRKDPLWEELGVEFDAFNDVWVSPDLPTSFVRHIFWCTGAGMGNEVYLQAELPGEQMRLVLLHEMRHVKLWHPYWKLLATFTLTVYWWNPLVWLGFRAFGQDLELACDASVMKRLEPGERKNYAETLLKLAGGEQLWNAPLYFGESDAELRIKALVAWKLWPWWRKILTWGLAIVMALFFYGGHQKPYLNQDLVLAWERTGSGTAGLVREMEKEMEETLKKSLLVEQPVEIEIIEIWDAPAIDLKRGVSDYPAVYVKDEDGIWYYVALHWSGNAENDWLYAFKIDKIPAPDTAGRDRLA